MLAERSTVTQKSAQRNSKLAAYIKILKFRLSFLVALSAVFGYAMAAGSTAGFLELLVIGLGGFFITGASNILNQIFEREYDAKMKRTADRPIPTGAMSIKESVIYALILAILGIGGIGYFFNLPSALLGIIGLLSYAFVYTPMKRMNSFAVFIGAIPGALPPLIGWVAMTGQIDQAGIVLFVFQFFWQFPHFWAIAWLLDEDYKKAGFKMLPSADGKSTHCAKLILLYTLSLVILPVFPFVTGMTSGVGAILLAIAGIGFLVPSILLFRKLSDKAAKLLLFGSFLYLPVIQIVFLTT